MTHHPIIVTIDGPAASGKSTIAKLLASKLGFFYINTGLMYRAITYKCIQNYLSVDTDLDKILELTKNTQFSLHNGMLLVDGKDLSLEAVQDKVNQSVSIYSKQEKIREILVNKQRLLARSHSVILDGRDTGSVVFPHAQFKFFLTASSSVRATRRLNELRQLFPMQSFIYSEILSDIERRDKMDSERVQSPLIIPTDAHIVDTSSMTIEDVAESLYKIIIQ